MIFWGEKLKKRSFNKKPSDFGKTIRCAPFRGCTVNNKKNSADSDNAFEIRWFKHEKHRQTFHLKKHLTPQY